jgi:hypothetical protein
VKSSSPPADITKSKTKIHQLASLLIQLGPATNAEQFQFSVDGKFVRSFAIRRTGWKVNIHIIIWTNEDYRDPKLVSHLKELLSPSRNMDFSDVVIVAASGKTFKAHKDILAGKVSYSINLNLAKRIDYCYSSKSYVCWDIPFWDG